MDEIFHPQSIAVAGASNSPASRGYDYTRHLLSYGYQGKIYPVNPRYEEILGLKAYPSLKDIPDSIDFVISCIPAAAVPDMLDECSQKNVKAVHLFTGRFRETGHKEDADREEEVLHKARKWNIRIIGPNCMGLYYPREGLSFAYNLPKEPGIVGMAAQTGGGSVYCVDIASLRGIRFSKVISYGNAIDLNECDYLDYFSQDKETKIIMMYIEGVKDGKRFLSSLRKAASIKPVIVVKGGRGESGGRAIASHTGSLAGSMNIWEALITQAGAISAQDIDEMVDFAVTFYYLPLVRGPRVGIVGGGGGASVLAADQCEEAGLKVIPLPQEIREELRNKNKPIWDWVSNPADTSIMGGFDINSIDVLEMMARNENFDILIGNIFDYALMARELVTSRIEDTVKGYIKVKEEITKPLIVVMGEKSPGIESYEDTRWKVLSEARTHLTNANIPIYSSIRQAARAARKLLDYYKNRS